MKSKGMMKPGKGIHTIMADAPTSWTLGSSPRVAPSAEKSFADGNDIEQLPRPKSHNSALKKPNIPKSSYPGLTRVPMRYRREFKGYEESQ